MGQSCKNCGEPTHFGNAVADRERLGWCPQCFANYRPPAPEIRAGDLPDPRPDGVCVACLASMAETRDGRFCKKCLSRLVRKMTPGHVGKGDSRRGADHAQERVYEPSPSGENATKALEGD